ncbi:MAG TPA: hypothetical protein DEF00_03200 [Candidatus Taylorbacteria bacterium]|nr:hypothetical protein [Candidatus Taylorbacteria bacterium]
MNTEHTKPQVDQNMPHEVEVEAGVNTHSHEREGDEIVKALVLNNAKGGFDVIGPQPNTNDGLATAEQVVEYIGNAEELVRGEATMSFIPFVMLTEKTTEGQIAKCVERGIVDGKMYPFMRTTKSTKGIKQWGRMLPVVKWCDKYGMKVHGHFEHPNLMYSDRDAELICLPFVEMFLQETEAQIFWEHGSDGRCVPYWKYFAKSERFFLGLTAHHLATNEDKARRDIRAECKPTIKTEPDRASLVQLVSENLPWVMAGADDAPHPEHAKHVHLGQCSCGAYTSPFLLSLYAHALEHLFVTAAGIETFINIKECQKNPLLAAGI